MIIKELYIENFGKLSGFRLKLSQGLNMLVHENGYGKTTVAAFIKAMLYGMEDSRKVSLFENMRKRYMPWQSGGFGGWLIYETDGEEYRIERSFGAKSSLDTLTLTALKTGKELPLQTASIGEMLFDIDAEGFDSTVFLSEHNIYEVGGTDSVSAKMAGITGIEGDIGGFDSAIELLEKRRRFYYKKGGSGEIRSTEEKLAALREQLRAIDGLAEECRERNLLIKEVAEKLAKLKSEQIEINEKKLTSDKEVARAGFAEEYARKRARLLEEHKKKEEILEFFKNGLPENLEITEHERGHCEGKRVLSESALQEVACQEIPCPFKCIPTAEEISEHLLRASSAPVKFKSKVLGLSLICTSASVLLAVLGAVVAPWLFVPCAILAAVSVLTAWRFGRPRTYENSDARAFIKSVYWADPEGEVLPILISMHAELEGYLQAKRAAEAELTKADESRDQKLTAAAELLRRAEEFLSRFPTTTDRPFDEIRHKLFDYSYVMDSLKRLERECDTFAKEYAISPHGEAVQPIESPEIINERARSLSEKISSLENEKYSLERANEAAYAKTESRLSIEAEIKDAEELVQLYRENLCVITKASELLSLAKVNMTSRYLDKTKERFEHYATLIDGKGGEFTMDTDFAVRKTDMGASRATEAYSRGTRELYLLATRLALIDSLYGKSAPPIILDDPFIAFDDGNVARAKQLLTRLGAEGRQIIYFSCSNSRA